MNAIAMLNRAPFVDLEDVFQLIGHFSLNIIADDVTQFLVIVRIPDKAVVKPD